MTNEELKKKIVEILEETEYEWTEEKNGYILQIFYDKLADALIAAGLKFDVNYSFTAAFNSVQAERERDLERRLSAAEHRAEVAERAGKEVMAYLYGYNNTDDIEKYWQVALQQAEKELEGKDND